MFSFPGRDKHDDDDVDDDIISTNSYNDELHSQPEEDVFVVVRIVYIIQIMSDLTQFYIWLRHLKLLSSSYTCPKADCSMNLCTVSEKRTTDMQMWRCNKHAVWRSIRKNSFFSHSHLSIKNIILMTYMWSRGYSLTSTVFETQLNKSTVLKWYRKCRELCTLFVSNRGPIGGVGNIVEIDESCFGNVKWNEENTPKPLWIFGAVVQGSHCRDLVLRVIEGPRSTENLLNIIKTYIKEGSTIFSDRWKGYSTLSYQGYTHLTVTHKLQFKNYETGCCTNTIEGIWACVKTHIGKGKRRYGNIQSYLDEFVWRRKAMQNPCLFSNFIRDIAKHFPPATKDN